MLCIRGLTAKRSADGINPQIIRDAMTIGEMLTDDLTRVDAVGFQVTCPCTPKGQGLSQVTGTENCAQNLPDLEGGGAFSSAIPKTGNPQTMSYQPKMRASTLRCARGSSWHHPRAAQAAALQEPAHAQDREFRGRGGGDGMTDASATIELRDLQLAIAIGT
jgi:hypothetical protein